MERQFIVTDKIGDIVARFPQAAELFKELQIDFCCGGDRPLIEAIREKNLDEDEVINQLNEMYTSTQDTGKQWDKASLSSLIEHIINKHHAFLQTELPVLSELVTKILRVHGSNHQDLVKVHRLFHTLKMDLEQHLIKEEQIIFPLIKAYEQSPSVTALNEIREKIEELESEHVNAGDILKQLRKITNDYEIPADACKTFTKAYLKLAELESDLFDHIHLENNLLFPRLEQSIVD
ncbi:iron-sulfur cluster repair di-iron protein [Vulcanibacillus modesticaldus]|uniref:Iron-sulfur cluster repair di-iron protein n=1 Tax=Vulcanibacillus modesticaldus TaxID=337097 RepID=A0A1D2YTZ6_9BACI|nr:iron-sulfur cluster repair di-iron protein [Vulcanibacillus modesticaldus]OEF99174.1 iron-sulfur cluster repair di-iron protein [Vulcanibacillus modesticaldus]